MKRITITLSLLLCYPGLLHPHILSNQLLKVADQAGLFNKAIVDILKVRQKIKEFINGKLQIKSVACPLTIVDDQGNNLPEKLEVIIKRPEAIFGGTFVVISPNHPHAAKYTTQQTQHAVQDYIHTVLQKNLVARYENPNTQGVFTGLFALHPITQEKLPLFIADYILENYSTRITHAHFAIPAHDQKDFDFARAHDLTIKLVINSVEQNKNSSPQFNKTTNQLMSAYMGDYDDCFVCNSDFLNGSVHTAPQTVISYLQDNDLGKEHLKNLVYHLGNKQYSLYELQVIEQTLQKSNKPLSATQQDLFKIIMIQAQSDFLAIVEQFLVNARDAKDLMIQLIDESCALRDNKDAYLLKWAHLETSEPEKIIFKRDINTMTNFYKFGSELVDFLGDFASSCPSAIEGLKNIKNS